MNDSIDIEKERIKGLVLKTLEKIEKNRPDIFNFLKLHLVRIEISDFNPFAHMRLGITQPLDKEKTLFAIYLNKFSLKILSDDSITGVIAHEMAHCLDSCKQGLRRRILDFLSKIGFFNFAYMHSENYIDKIAISLGFEKEIEKLRKEARVEITKLPSNHKPYTETFETKNSVLNLECKNCGKGYRGDYFYDGGILGGFVNIFYNGVPVGRIEAKGKLDIEDVQKEGICHFCKERSLVIKSRDSFDNF